MFGTTWVHCPTLSKQVTNKTDARKVGKNRHARRRRNRRRRIRRQKKERVEKKK